VAVRFVVAGDSVDLIGGVFFVGPTSQLTHGSLPSGAGFPCVHIRWPGRRSQEPSSA
jgi:hypothetical protein